jgi:hypothetical protein
MPDPAQTERRLALFCRISAVVYAFGAVSFAATPRLTFRLITLDQAPVGWTAQAMFWNVLAVAMMTAIATACWLAAKAPVERRHLLLPVVVAKLTSSVLAALHLISFHEPGWQAVGAIILTDFPLFLLTFFAWRTSLL